jgi:hypothetical protein
VLSTKFQILLPIMGAMVKAEVQSLKEGAPNFNLCAMVKAEVQSLKEGAPNFNLCAMVGPLASDWLGHVPAYLRKHGTASDPCQGT